MLPSLIGRGVGGEGGTSSRSNRLLWNPAWWALLLALPALWPLLRPGFFISDDGRFHVYRIAALVEAWRQGVFYPRLFPEFGFGYGQAVLSFYAPLSYYPAALLTFLGLGPAVAMQLALALGFLVAAWAAYGYARSLWGPAGGVLAAVAYTYFPYHLADAYLRGALPEHFAFVWPPLILWAYVAAFREEKPLRPLLWGALAWAALVCTHNLTALLMAPVTAFYLLLLACWTGRWQRLPVVLSSLALTLGLSAAFWLPALAESRYVGISLGPSDGYRRHLAPLGSLIDSSLFYRYPPTGAPYHPLSWLSVLLLLVVLILVVRIALTKPPPPPSPATRLPLPTSENVKFEARQSAPAIPPTPFLPRKTGEEGGAERSEAGKSGGLQRHSTPTTDLPVRLAAYAARWVMKSATRGRVGWGPLSTPILFFGLLLTVVAVFMITTASLPIWRPLTPILGHLQYPWRFLTLAAVGFLTLAGALPSLLPRRGRRALAGLAILALLAVPLPTIPVQRLDMPNAEVWAPDRMWREDAEAGQIGATWTGEFLPLTVTEQRWALGRPRGGATDGPAPAARPAVRLTQIGYTRYDLEIETAIPMSVRLHHFYLPGWAAEINGHPVRTYPTGELGLVTVDVPAGMHRLAFRFVSTPARTAGTILSMLAATLWAILAWRERRSSRDLALFAILLLGVALLLGLNSLGIGQRARQPVPVEAALEDVALLIGYDAAPAREQDALDVTLYWFALRDTATNYKAFVHLVGKDGQVAAQHDGDPVGGFTPTTRWRPGEIIADRHRLLLPSGLRGAYRLKAGLYRLEPLRNLTVEPPSPDGRVDLGEVTIR